MSLETLAAPWSYDELQLMGAELGDTVEFVNESEEVKIGVIFLLNKMALYVLTPDDEIVKFGRTTLISLDNQWGIVGLAKEQIRISAETWKNAKKRANTSRNTRTK